MKLRKPFPDGSFPALERDRQIEMLIEFDIGEFMLPVRIGVLKKVLALGRYLVDIVEEPLFGVCSDYEQDITREFRTWRNLQKYEPGTRLRRSYLCERRSWSLSNDAYRTLVDSWSSQSASWIPFGS